jgi:hypothetical protein
MRSITRGDHLLTIAKFDSLESGGYSEDSDSRSEDEDAVEPQLPSESESGEDDDEASAGPASKNALVDFVAHLPLASTKRKAGDSSEDVGTSLHPQDSASLSTKRRRVLPSHQGPGGREDAGEFGMGAGTCSICVNQIARSPAHRIICSCYSLKTHIIFSYRVRPVLQIDH